MANFGKHLKKNFGHVADGLRKIMRSTIDSKNVSGKDAFLALAGVVGAVVGAGFALYAAPLLTLGVYTAAVAASYTYGYAKNPDEPSPGAVDSLLIGVSAGVYASIYGVRAVAGIPYALVAGAGAVLRTFVDAAKDKSVSFTVDIDNQAQRIEAPAQQALPAPVANDFNHIVSPKQEEREVLHVTVERVNDKIRKI